MAFCLFVRSGNPAAKVSNGRPLPAAPSYDESRYTWDSGYDEIRDVTPGDAARMTSPDGYEVPVVHEEQEEECIYDVARPDLAGNEGRPSLRRPMYMNEDSFSTHM